MSQPADPARGDNASSTRPEGDQPAEAIVPPPAAIPEVLTDRVAVVTGAGSGLGRGIAEGLARAGARVALLDIDLDAAEETHARISSAVAPHQSLAVRADVTDESQVAEAFEKALEAFGGLDVCVPAAGVAPAYPLAEFPVDAWRKALEINLTGYFLAAREAARIMVGRKRGGSIVLVSSKSGLDASTNNSAYNATKAAEVHLARGWAKELGEHGIRVNAIAPGNVFKGSKIWNEDYIRAAAEKRGIEPEEVIPYYVGLTALGIEIEPEDVAGVVVWLASDAARTITGQTIVCDAGQVFVR